MSSTSNTPGNSSNNRPFKDTKKKGKHKAAETSIEAWKIINERGQPQREKARVYAILDQLQPVTSRKLSETLKIERTNITRTLKDLVTAGIIKIACKAKCPFSGMTVYHYSKIDWKPEENKEVPND